MSIKSFVVMNVDALYGICFSRLDSRLNSIYNNQTVCEVFAKDIRDVPRLRRGFFV